MKRFIAWLLSLVQKKPVYTQPVQAPAVGQATPVAVPATPVAVMATLVGETPVIDYGLYIYDARTGQKHTPYTLQLLYQPLPQGWDWKEWAKVAGVVDPTTHTNTGEKIEAQVSRVYVSRAVLNMAGFREALLTVPGRIEVSSGQGFILSYAHGAQSKGYITAVANGLNIGHGPDWTLGPGDYVIDFTGEVPAVRIAVKIRPAL
jgi:hypothetical protein